MTYHHGWLFVGETNGNVRELFNHARTATYLQTSAALGCGRVRNILDDGGCPAYRWVPPDTDGGPLVAYRLLDDERENVLLNDEETEILYADYRQAENGWWEQSYSTPQLDRAPWYSDAYPESAQGLGFWVTEWTGLDSGHVQRGVTAVGTANGGGVFGALGAGYREMGFEVTLLGESERALDYLFRWLDATLSSVCATCETDTIIIRRYCPDIDPTNLDSAADGAAEMRKVGLMSGLQWGAPPVEREGCFIRSVNFTLAVGDPCMYGACTDQVITQEMDWAACFAAATLDSERETCRPTCAEMIGDCRWVFDYEVDSPSAVAPVVVLTAGAEAATWPMRVRTYANPLGMEPDDICSAALLAEVYVTSLPPSTEVMYDMAARTVMFRSAATGGWINGFAYVAPNDVGVPRFANLGCGAYTTIIEPADFCTDEAPDADRNFADITLSTRDRMGCA